ncbi:alpha-ketoacid dehydrogenase subunit beta [Baekduia soli]|uniref:Alpha-ketoacid dehydrogenase subunit beta n=1 Tax=Baekduia soli TaxID=496014 RepID=A0A5B8U153_9ACTN|nr:transketolase C-terminal domain-containing protein [Baekduia soli]QEC46759.1 alpha-ketoacid dehydrogenase subunit beta [Baekduia soli]
MSAETMTVREAARRSLTEEMEADARVWVLGEDVGRGGLFGQYTGMVDAFGPDRIVDTPISESTIMGVAVGSALMGGRPVAEMRLCDFAVCATDELVNQAAKNRYMFGGQGRVPLLVRQPCGIGRSTAAQHSQSLESWYCHVPGLVVLAPSSPADTFGLLKTAIRSDDPVVYFEHKLLWGVEGDVDVDAAPIEVGRAARRREGTDVTIVAWSSMVADALAAAEALHAQDGISAEVLDLRSLWPWDEAAVLESAARTGALLVAQESVRVAGFGAEVAATVAEETGVRIGRVGCPRVPMPYSQPLEAEIRVGAADVAAAARALVER